MIQIGMVYALSQAMNKRCTGCGLDRPLDDFGPHKGLAHASGTCRPCDAEATRRYRARNVEKVRRASREAARQLRLDPAKRERLLETERRAYARTGKARQRARLEAMKRDDFFKWKSLRSYVWLTGDQLRELWDGQGGLCALTGRPLDRTAHLDHKIPRSRGGPDTFENAQWLCAEANQAKRNLLDGEFIALCREVVAHQEALLAHLAQRRAA